MCVCALRCLLVLVNFQVSASNTDLRIMSLFRGGSHRSFVFVEKLIFVSFQNLWGCCTLRAIFGNVLDNARTGLCTGSNRRIVTSWDQSYFAMIWLEDGASHLGVCLDQESQYDYLRLPTNENDRSSSRWDGFGAWSLLQEQWMFIF